MSTPTNPVKAPVITTADTSATSLVLTKNEIVKVDTTEFFVPLSRDLSDISLIEFKGDLSKLFLPMIYMNKLICIYNQSSSDVDVFLPEADVSGYKYGTSKVLLKTKTTFILYRFTDVPIMLDCNPGP